MKWIKDLIMDQKRGNLKIKGKINHRSKMEWIKCEIIYESEAVWSKDQARN